MSQAYPSHTYNLLRHTPALIYFCSGWGFFDTAQSSFTRKIILLANPSHNHHHQQNSKIQSPPTRLNRLPLVFYKPITGKSPRIKMPNHSIGVASVR